MDLIHEVEHTLIKERLLHKGDTVAVAVSGGPDSTALMHILHMLSPDWDLKLIVVHVNHRFRGQESDEEAAAVAAMAEQLGWPCEIGNIDVPGFMKHKNLNAQEAAREKRYEYLLDAADKHGATRIALAHHADDQAETVLMRLIRGAGPGGLAGIPIRRSEKKVELIRPMLRIYKAEITAYCLLNGLLVSHDSSNAERKYFRNRIRLDVMPFLLQYNNQLPQSLNRLSELMAAENEYLAEETERLYRQHVERREAGSYFSCRAFALFPLALQRRLIKQILNGMSDETDFLDFSKIETIRSAALQKSPASVVLDVNDDLQFIREYDLAGLAHRTSNVPVNYQYLIHSGSGRLEIAEASCMIRFRLLNDSNEPGTETHRHEYSAIFDYSALVFPLTVRNRREGDRISIVGMNGSKKVKNLFIDEKVSRTIRNRIPLIFNGDNTLLWIPGFRKSTHAAADESTEQVWFMEVSLPIR